MSAIFEEAREIANSIQARKPGLEDKAARLKAELRDVEAQLVAIERITYRLASFREHANGRKQCPACWIENEVATDLTAIPSDNRNDKFECRTCGFEVVTSV